MFTTFFQPLPRNVNVISIQSYLLNYSTGGMACGSEAISCVVNVCSATFNVMMSPCAVISNTTDIVTVNVSAASVLGIGPALQTGIGTASYNHHY